MGRFFKIFFVLFVLAFIGIQYIDVDRTNPPVTADIEAPNEVKTIFKTACYDCHSNETKWPWFSKVAPISWFITNDVKEGRVALNFSNWENLYSEKQTELKRKIWTQVNKDDMPMLSYTYVHPDASLGLPQKGIIQKWALGNGFWK